MPNALDRAFFNALVDDTGGGTDGSFVDKAFVDSILDDVDEANTDVQASTVTGTNHNFALASVGAAILRWNGASAVTFTGWANGTAGRSVLFQNVTAAQIATFQHDNGVDSTAANRFSNPESAAAAVGPGCNAIVWYDGTTSRWRVRVLAGQLTFPATQAPSTDAHTLDDYEEGTWTPSVGGSTSESGQTYSVQVGRYIKIGKLVHIQGRVVLTALGTITGSVVIKGLPFTSVNATDAFSTVAVAQWGGMTTALCFAGGYIAPNSTQITITAAKTAAVTATTSLAQADLSNTTDFIFSGSYETTT